MRLLFVAAIAALVTCVVTSPVSQDDATTLASLQDELVDATTVQGVNRRQGIYEDDEADDVAGVTTDTLIVDDDVKSFRYPLEPEAATTDYGDDVQHDEGEPLDSRIMEQAGITHVVQRDKDSMPYYAGRANCQCGRPGERSHPLRIVNGTVIRINDYPWTVALVRKRWIGRPKGAYCGGTLINNVSRTTAMFRNIEFLV